MHNLLIRTVSGAVMLGLVLGALTWSPWSFGALLFVILVGGQLEFYLMARMSGVSPQRWMGLAAGVALFAFHFVVFLQFDRGVTALDATLVWCFALYLLLLVPSMFVCELFRASATPMANLGATLLGVVYVAVPMSLMLFIPLLATGGEWNPWPLLFYIFIIWANDVFAYLVGMTFGRHRLFERLSPKKSWEGFFGGLAGAVAMGVLASWLLEANAALWIGLSVVASITGVFGDLAESMFKRACGVKDSGGAIPGHGGVLDRFDALLLSVPFVFVYLLLFAGVRLLNL